MAKIVGNTTVELQENVHSISQSAAQGFGTEHMQSGGGDGTWNVQSLKYLYTHTY